MRKSITALIAAIILVAAVTVPAFASGGFDQYGYNRPAGIFNGTYLSYCMSPDSSGNGGGTEVNCLAAWTLTTPINGSVVYAYDQLIMKWNPAWDACNASNGNPADCAGAWITNEENGQVPGGSGAVWHYKIIWSSVCAAGGTPTDGGYCVWGSYEVIMDQGIDPNWGSGHWFNALATPNGLGAQP